MQLKRSASRPDLTAALFTEGLQREQRFERLSVEGRLPDGLAGTLYRNGPGLFESFGRPYRHPFEGDGALSAVRLDGAGGAEGAVRITQSAGLREERAAGRPLYGLNLPWLQRMRNVLRGKQKNTANTNALHWRGRLFALMEAALPTELDPVTLDTIGETDLGGLVSGGFSAHPHRVAARRATYNFGLEYGRNTRLHLYELPDDGPARRLGAVALPAPPMLHDFIATETHLVFFVSPVRVNVPRMYLSLGGFEDLFQWRPSFGTEVLCVPIDRPSEVVRFEVDPFFQWHFGNAFTRQGELVIDYVRYPDFASFYDIGRPAALDTALAEGRYHRAVVSPGARTVRTEQRCDVACEFPKVDPRVEGSAHRYAWSTVGDLAGVARHDLETGELLVHELPRSQRALEPIFVPRPGGAESDGHLLVMCAEAERSFLAVYDAARVPDGPRARIWFDQRIPVTFHGTWVGSPS